MRWPFKQFVELALATDPVKTVNMSQEATVEALQGYRDLVAALQAELDKRLPHILAQLEAIPASAAEAAWAESTYNRTWFAALPYSADAVQQIAATLVRLFTPVLGKNDLWAAVAAGDFSGIIADEAEEELNDDADDLG